MRHTEERSAPAIPSPRGRAMRPWSALALASLAALPSTHAAPLDEARKLEGATWYTVSVGGKRVGYAFRQVEVDERADNGPILRVSERMVAAIQLGKDGPPLKAESDVVSTYDASLRPLRLTMKSNELGRLRELDARITETTIEVTIRAAGEERKETIPLTPEFGSDLPLVLAIAHGRAEVGDTFEFDGFNPDIAAMDHFVATITERKTLDDGQVAYLLKSRSTRLPVEVLTLIADDGVVISQSMPAMMNMTIERVSEQEALAEVAPLVLSSEIPTNKKIPNPQRLDMMRVRIRAGAQRTAEFLPTTARQTVQAEGDAAVVTVTRLRREGPAATIPIPGEEFSQYLKASERAQLDCPAIVDKAREIIGDEKDARHAAELIVHWVYENVEKKSSEPRPVSAREVLEQMSGDCTEHAVLCGALAGAVGIPAKFCAGIAYYRGAFFYHAWNEVYIGEWVEMDPAWDEVSVDAGHILLTAGALDTESMAKMSLVAGRTLGVIEVDILDYELGDDH